MTTIDQGDTTERLGDEPFVIETPDDEAVAPDGDDLRVIEDAAQTPGLEEDSCTGDYVVPIIHARIPGRIMDVAFWAALGTVALVGTLDLPAAGILAGGFFIIRRRHA